MLKLFAVSAGCKKFDAHSLFSIAQHRWVEQAIQRDAPFIQKQS